MSLDTVLTVFPPSYFSDQYKKQFYIHVLCDIYIFTIIIFLSKHPTQLLLLCLSLAIILIVFENVLPFISSSSNLSFWLLILCLFFCVFFFLCYYIFLSTAGWFFFFFFYMQICSFFSPLPHDHTLTFVRRHQNRVGRQVGDYQPHRLNRSREGFKSCLRLLKLEIIPALITIHIRQHFIFLMPSNAMIKERKKAWEDLLRQGEKTLKPYKWTRLSWIQLSEGAVYFTSL